MNLAQDARRVSLLAERRVGDLRVGNPVAPIPARDPEELVLIERIVPVVGAFHVREHHAERARNVRVREREIIPQ